LKYYYYYYYFLRPTSTKPPAEILKLNNALLHDLYSANFEDRVGGAETVPYWDICPLKLHQSMPFTEKIILQNFLHLNPQVFSAQVGYLSVPECTRWQMVHIMNLHCRSVL